MKAVKDKEDKVISSADKTRFLVYVLNEQNNTCILLQRT
jgi:hypothetical protein